MKKFQIYNNELEFVASPNSYYYETGFCSKFRTEWSGIVMEFKDIPSFWINLQTVSNCQEGTTLDNFVHSSQLLAKNGSLYIPFPQQMDRLVSFSLGPFEPLGKPIRVKNIATTCVSIAPVTFSHTKPFVSQDIIPLYQLLSLLAFLWSLL
jgi:hypothetical protein